MKSKIPPDYAGRIRQLRQRLGLTQMRLAELLDVSFASVNRWENGQTKPSKMAWQKFERAEILGFLADDIPGRSVREKAAEYKTGGESAHDLDFTTPSDLISCVVEGYRLSYGHLFNPAFATEISLIDSLPHQRVAVYEHMLNQPRLRFLLADDAGAGKTIMTGLYIREMLARRLIHRILIVTPAGLVGNWESEMNHLFSLPFHIVSGSDAKDSNPFVRGNGDLAIVSVDTLAGERMFKRLQEPEVAPYDLVVFDEAHKLAADREPDFRLRKTDRYRLGEALAGFHTDRDRWRLDWSARHVLLLTATPHMGKDFPYYCLWRLLEPEALSTFEAFNAYPPEARRRHFIRRAKEEMIRFDGTKIYPPRHSDTLSYDLTQGEISEQALYDKTTQYIEYYYNRARILNRSAARLAMSIFQRRLASSTYALMRSFERRLERLRNLMDDIRSGRITPQQLQARQRKLDQEVRDVLIESTADEEVFQDGREENEISQEQALGGVVATSLAELEAECQQVEELLELSQKVYEQGQESKFNKLCEVLEDKKYRDEKILIFTEHRDTLTYLVRQLEGMGYTGQVVQIHGGMDYLQREEIVATFRRPVADGGARYLVATDAAGEGINLQVCWLMINYDIPWNPARLEQRMGRIHRYGQKHDVVIVNLVAGKTREGRVLRILLEKMERIRRELRSDKVFDVVGRLFEGVSLRAYLEQAVTEEGADQAEQFIEGHLTPEQVRALQERERRLYGDGGDVRRNLPRLQESLELETYRRLLPGYVRRFFERAAPLVDIGFDGNLEAAFSLRPLRPGALDPLWPVMEAYGSERLNRLTFNRPDNDDAPVVFLHPGEPLFDRFCAYVTGRFSRQALRGGVFVDPTARQPYLFHLAEVTVLRQANPGVEVFAHEETLETRLVGLRQEADGKIEICPLETLLLLKGGEGLPPEALSLAAAARDRLSVVHAFLMSEVVQPLVEARRQAILANLPESEQFLKRGYAYQEAELAAARSRYRQKAESGDPRARQELTRVRERQRILATQQEAALAGIRREPDLVAPGEIRFLAHALVVPSSDPRDIQRRDEAVEAIAMQVAVAYEQAAGANVRNVSTPELARGVGLGDKPGFDLLSYRPDSEIRLIEVKGRAGVGDVIISDNEWSSACNHREKFWLYVVFDCASTHPRLIRIQNPWSKLLAKAKAYTLDQATILNSGE